MKNVLITAPANGLVILIACVGISAFNIYILGNCDSKIGCSGVIWFSVLLGSITGVISTAAYITSFSLINREIASFKVALATGVILTPVAFTIMDWGVGLIPMAVGWFFLSVAVVFLCSRTIGGKRANT